MVRTESDRFCIYKYIRFGGKKTQNNLMRYSTGKGKKESKDQWQLLEFWLIQLDESLLPCLEIRSKGEDRV